MFLEPGEQSRPPHIIQAWIDCITSANEWALDVGLAARLDLETEGYLAVRGMVAPAPYLPGGRFL